MRKLIISMSFFFVLCGVSYAEEPTVPKHTIYLSTTSVSDSKDNDAYAVVTVIDIEINELVLISYDLPKLKKIRGIARTGLYVNPADYKQVNSARK